MFLWAIYEGKSEQYARGLAFTTLIIANLALIWTNRSSTQTVIQTFRSWNVALWAVAAGALTLLGLVLNGQVLNDLLRISTLDFGDIAICGLAGSASVAWFEALKLFVKPSGETAAEYS